MRATIKKPNQALKTKKEIKMKISRRSIIWNRLNFLFSGLVIKTIVVTAQPVPFPGQPLVGPGSIEHYAHLEITIHDFGSSSEGFWLYEPASPTPATAPVIIFMHGYGAYNPMVYGKWIKHLVAQGNIVIYPRYQWNLILPKADKFPETAAKGIKDALEVLQTENHVRPNLEKVCYVGHSYGGTINANLAVNWQKLGVPKPAGMFLAQPGTGPLAGAILDDYAGMPPDLNLICLAGSQDYVVGDRLARRIFETAVNTPMRNFLMHYPDSSDARAIYASHHEPYCIDYDMDNGVRNYTAVRTISTSRLDEVDFYCYWKLADALIYYTREGKYKEYAFGRTPEQTYMGLWPDGTPIKPMKVLLPTELELKKQNADKPVLAAER
jgi:pimeloyl-ACP methyl ester carboxylesterase